MTVGIETVAGRYALQPKPTSGGMADVYRANDMQSNGRTVAVKLFRNSALEHSILLEAFRRETKALTDLKHPGIVEMYDSGLDVPRGQLFVVLEWVNEGLPTFLTKHPPEGWDSFYTEVGKPVLDALAFAHSRKIIHRDLKPENILIDASGSPKLADFGIAQIRTLIQPGLTLNQFASRPYAPREEDDRQYTYTRDVHAFAALVLACLTPIKLVTYEDLAQALAEVDLPPDIFQLISLGLSPDPARRPVNAAVLLAEIARIQDRRQEEWAPKEILFLSLSQNAVGNVRKHFPHESQAAIEKSLLKDLDIFAFAPFIAPDNTRPRDQYSLYGTEFHYQVVVDKFKQAHLVILNIWQLSPTLIEKRRELAYLPNCELRFGIPVEHLKAKQFVLQLQEECEKHESELRDKDAADREKEVFRVWERVLRAKEDNERGKEKPLRYSRVHISGNRARFTLDREIDEDIAGQPRQVRSGDVIYLAGEVDEVIGNTLVLYLTERFSNTDIENLPSKGEIAVDISRAKIALDRQKAALDAVKYDRALRPDIRQLIVHPQRNREPDSTPTLEYIHKDLDDPKRDAVRAALGSQDFLLVEGPPGTGKTTFIAEVVLQTLRSNPEARILLTSQTHVALDNAIERLRKIDRQLSIVRIGRLTDDRISKNVASLLLENQMDKWSETVLAEGQHFLEQWAKDKGISRHYFEIASGLRKLGLSNRGIRDRQLAINEREEQLQDLLGTNPLLKDETKTKHIKGSSEEITQIQQEVARVKTELASLKREQTRLRDDLKSKDPILSEILTQSDADLEEWADTFSPSGPQSASFKRLVDTYTEWEIRFGKSADFQAALLATCQVVAGTCVGIAAIKGIQDVEFDLCIVDEASKATPTETIVPLTRSRRWILVGDPRQLPPFVEDQLVDAQMLESSGLTTDDLRKTLFDRLELSLPSGCHKALLMQHRMVPEIGNLISDCFYDGRLESAPRKALKTFIKVLPRPVTWLTTATALDRFDVCKHQSHC